MYAAKEHNVLRWDGCGVFETLTSIELLPRTVGQDQVRQSCRTSSACTFVGWDAPPVQCPPSLSI